MATFSYNAIGNLTYKSDVGSYNYPGQARPHGVTSISGGVINTSFVYHAKGNTRVGQWPERHLHAVQQAGDHQARRYRHRLLA